MRRRGRTGKYRTSLRTFVSVVLLLVILFILVRWVYNGMLTQRQAKTALAEAQHKHERLETRLMQVEKRNTLLDSKTGERDFLVERQGMIGQGERVLILIEEKNAQPQLVEEPSKKGWWSRLFNFNNH